jgi:hypothetical protein
MSGTRRQPFLTHSLRLARTSSDGAYQAFPINPVANFGDFIANLQLNVLPQGPTQTSFERSQPCCADPQRVIDLLVAARRRA